MSAGQAEVTHLHDDAARSLVEALVTFVNSRTQPITLVEMPDQVLKLDQAAQLLQVSEDTLRKEAGDGRVPGLKVGSQWRFSRKALLDHISGETA